MNLIKCLRNNGPLCERASILAEKSESGWSLVYPGGNEPLVTDGETTILGWGKLDGPALTSGSLIIPARALA